MKRAQMISIRKATPEEAGLLSTVTLAAKRHWNYPEKWMQLWIPELTFSPEYILENEVWMAVIDDIPVAYYSLQKKQKVSRHCEPPLLCFGGEAISNKARRSLRWDTSPGRPWQGERPPRDDGDCLWLENLWVLPEYMGQGIGRQLFEHALERSRERGMSILKIEADPNAQGFYEKMGAYKSGDHQYELDGQLRVLPVMEINLSSRT